MKNQTNAIACQRYEKHALIKMLFQHYMLLFSLLFVFTPVLIFGQENISGTCEAPEPSMADVQMRQSLQAQMSNMVTSGFVNTNYEVPLHVYIFVGPDGNPPNGESFILEAFARKLQRVNEVFPEQLQFYICEVDNIDVILPNETAQKQYLIDEGLWDDNTFNIIINSDTAANSWYTSDYAQIAASSSSAVIAHELGHAFMLYHTFTRTVFTYDDQFCMVLYPDNTFNTQCQSGMSPFQISAYYPDCSTAQNFCDCTNDMICDTNVDPDGGYAQDDICNEPEYPCVLNVDGQDEEYFPPYTNMMSYHGSRNKFSDDQKDVMVEALLTLDSRAHLIDDDEPVCEDLGIPDFFLAIIGKVDRVRIRDGAFNFPPLRSTIISNPLLTTGNNFVGITVYNGNYALASSNNGSVSPFYPDEAQFGLSANPATLDEYQTAAGLDANDIWLTRRHILAIEELPKPYAWIAADVTNDGNISTLDLIHMQKVILGLVESFSNVPAWRLFTNLFTR